MTATALGLISQALRALGVLGTGVDASASQGAEALVILNQMIDGWAIDGDVSILSYARNAFPLTANTASYTIGAGGDFNVTRPTSIFESRVIPDTSLASAQQTELPVDVLSAQRWAQKVLKNYTATYPTELFYDEAFNNATARGTIWLFPIPTASNVSLILYLPTILGQFADLSTSYSFAPGYPEAIVPNLAVTLAPYFGKPATDLALIVRQAARAKALVETQNVTVPQMASDPALRGRGGFDTRAGR